MRSALRARVFCRSLRAAGTVISAVANLLSIQLGDRYVPLQLTPEQLKEQTLQLLIHRVRDMSLRKPLLCLVEDAHWIDPTSSELLSRMIPELKAYRIFVIVTSRTPTENFRLHHETPLMHLPLAQLDRQHAEEVLRHNVGDRTMHPGECGDHRARRRHAIVYRGIEQGRDGVGMAAVTGEDPTMRGAMLEGVVPATL